MKWTLINNIVETLDGDHCTAMESTDTSTNSNMGNVAKTK